MSEENREDIAALARGGRTNVIGFLIRLLARIPFLIIASRLYGAEAMGRFASALVVVEFAAQLCTLGQKRGLASRLTEDSQHPANTIADAMLLNTILALVATALIWLFPITMYPNGNFVQAEHLLVLAILPSGLTDIALSALAYRFDVATSVRARAIAEPWALSIAAGLLYFLEPNGGLALAYLASMFAAWFVAMIPLLRSYGLPQQWQPHPMHIARLAAANVPLAMADLVEWGTRKIDVFILRFFVGEGTLGVYYFAQQFASLPQKLKSSFEPVLGPVITRNVATGNHSAIAAQVSQTGLWIVIAQIGIALALGVTSTGLMGLGGPGFVGGTPALLFLLLAEVLASTAVVCEAALVYLARYRNLVLSLMTIGLQAALTLGGMMLGRHFGLNHAALAAMAAGALMLSLCFASIFKAKLLKEIAQTPIKTWRWSLLIAVVPALAFGLIAVFILPEWAGIIVGIFGTLAVFVTLIWRNVFTLDDRMIFRRDMAGGKG